MGVLVYLQTFCRHPIKISLSPSLACLNADLCGSGFKVRQMHKDSSVPGARGILKLLDLNTCVCKHVCKVCVSSWSKDALHMGNFSHDLAGRGHNPSLLLLASFTSVTFQDSSGSRGIHRYFDCLFIYGMWHVLNSCEILYFIILGNCWSEATCSSSITLVIALKSTENSDLNFNSTLKLDLGLEV